MATASTSDASQAGSACDLPPAEARATSRWAASLQRARWTALLLAALVDAPCPNHRRNDTLAHGLGLGFGLGQRRQVHGLRMSSASWSLQDGEAACARAFAGMHGCGHLQMRPTSDESASSAHTIALPLTCKIVMPMSVAYMLMHSR